MNGPATGHLPSSARRTPISTYRLQLNDDFTFADAQNVLPYLDDLGVTDLYLSPILQATPGSTHGYDVVDHTQISRELGGLAGFISLAQATHERGMGIVVDVVPNHMSVPTPVWLNHAMWSLLKYGPESPFANWFDVDISSPILMPILGSRIGTVLAKQELEVVEMVVPTEPELGKQFVLRYYDHYLPLQEGTELLPMSVLAERQFYRLAYWRVANEELNYRRFFDVGSLAAIRVEDPEVFNATHGLLLDLHQRGLIDGFRVDHPDGLADPRGYFKRLSEATCGAWVVAEKILEENEELPNDWPVAGTTGYDASYRITNLNTDPQGALTLGVVMQAITEDSPSDFPAIIEASKRQIVSSSLFAEMRHLAYIVTKVCADDIRLRDHTFVSLLECLVELVIAFDRYRAYVVPGELAPSISQETIYNAAEIAKGQLDTERYDTMELITDLLLGVEVGTASRITEDRRAEIQIRFQQLCGAVMAKGMEDTAFYRWTHLTSLCEVGSNPAHFGLSPDELHTWAARIQAVWPATMTCGSTHDTKRGEDVRAQLGVLSEFPSEWATLVTKLRGICRSFLPSKTFGQAENLLWQTLAGTWTADGPISWERLRQYLIKAFREQKTWTTWTSSNIEKEALFLEFAAEVLESSEVQSCFEEWLKLTAESSRTAILSSKALQLTLPGVADVYQGSEVIQNSLVDPDNRRPIDFEKLAAQLQKLDSGATPSALATEKQQLVSAILRLRRQHPQVFVSAQATYSPLPLSTGYAVAFTRGNGTEPLVATVASRLASSRSSREGWAHAEVILPEGNWEDIVSHTVYQGGAQALDNLLGNTPVKVLVRVADSV